MIYDIVEGLIDKQKTRWAPFKTKIVELIYTILLVS
jgi:hypothetical protein